MPENQTLVHRHPARRWDGMRLRRPGRESRLTRRMQAFKVARLIEGAEPAVLLDLAFFVDDVLARDRIKLLYLEFIRRIALILGSRVKVPGPGTGNESDLLANGHTDTSVVRACGLYLLAACAHLRQHGVDTFFIDDTQTLARQAQSHPALFALHPQAPVV